MKPNEFLKQTIIEMHFHTREVSRCAQATAAEGIASVADKGYTTLVVTDHYTPDYFAEYAHLAWSDQVKHYLSGYQAARQMGEKLGLTVLPGMEIRFANNFNDYLVYGISEALLLNHPHLYKLGIRDFSRFCREQGLLIYQAHPFRNHMTITPPEYLDGLEGWNGHIRHDSRNDFARAWAEKNELPVIGGSDFHRVGDEGHGGLLTDCSIKTQSDLLKMLRNEDYYLIQSQKKPMKTRLFGSIGSIGSK